MLGLSIREPVARNKMKKILIVISLLYVSACSPGLENLQYYKKEVAKYYESGKYGLEAREIIEDALDKIKDAPSVINPAVVFDVDETTLSNYKYIKKISFGYIHSDWEKWMSKAQAKAILQTKYLYDYLVEHNYKIIVLTARSEEQYDATYKNLVDEGYTQIDTLICRPLKDTKIPSSLFKERERKKLTESGYNIVACVGDQESDIWGEDTGIKVKLPNLMYIVN